MSNYVIKLICTLEHKKCYVNGTGFLCSEYGHIVTCAHNIVHCKNYNVYYKNRIYNAKFICIDKRIDIAILKIDEKTPCPTFARILQYGSCYTYGFHHDHVCLSYQTGSIMTLNYVSKYAIDSTLTTIRGFKGASGSPIFNENHEIIGIFSYESNIGCGGVALRLIQQFLGKINFASSEINVQRSHTGIIVKPLTIDHIIQNNITELIKHVKGELVTKVLQNCEICTHDIIININSNVVGCGFISSESYVHYMNHKSRVKIVYLSSKDNYAQKSCILHTIPFPDLYDKPLEDTTILNLNF